MIRKRYHQKWKFYSPDAVLTSSVLKCAGRTYIAFGGHDKRLYLMDKERNLLDSVALDGSRRRGLYLHRAGDGSRGRVQRCEPLPRQLDGRRERRPGRATARDRRARVRADAIPGGRRGLRILTPVTRETARTFGDNSRGT